MPIRIALAGNPNCGKTTLFNALTGSNQYVGNWPGVTVEKKEGYLKNSFKKTDETVLITDLPGIYSLSPYSPEERCARRFLVGERPDVILNLVDGTNLERNLYLTTQLTELGISVVVAVNMMDIVEKNGGRIDIPALSRMLHCRVVKISARQGTGLSHAIDAALDAAREHGTQIPVCARYSANVENALSHIAQLSLSRIPAEQRRWYALRLFVRDAEIRNTSSLRLPSAVQEKTTAHLEAVIQKTEQECGDTAEAILTNERYRIITQIVSRCYTQKQDKALSVSAKIDRIATGRYTAFPLFALIMFGVYTLSIGSIGGYLSALTSDTLIGAHFIPAAERILTRAGCAPWLISLFTDGILGGVGAVLGFVPQMMILFFLLSILEDVGYMARVAFIMDRLFCYFGLSGKSFISLMIAAGCGVPGVMATRTIEQERDRKLTILTACFIPCGAKMPLVGLIASALFGGSAVIAVSAYLVGIASVLLSGLILKKTRLFSGEPAPFILELPAYHLPKPENILKNTWERCKGYICRAGTVILLASVLIWLLHSLSFVNGLHYIGKGQIGQSGETSILTAIGKIAAPFFVPLGFGTWQAAVAVLLGLLAKEEIVGVFGALAAMEGVSMQTFCLELFRTSQAAEAAIAGYSFMVFNLLCAPCVAAMTAIHHEMRCLKWTVFSIAYMCAFAYAVSLMIYQFALFYFDGGSLWGFTAAVCILAGFLCRLLPKRGIPSKYEKSRRRGKSPYHPTVSKNAQ